MSKSDLISFIVLAVINGGLLYFLGWVRGYNQAKPEWYTRGWSIGRHSSTVANGTSEFFADHKFDEVTREDAGYGI